MLYASSDLCFLLYFVHFVNEESDEQSILLIWDFVVDEFCRGVPPHENRKPEQLIHCLSGGLPGVCPLGGAFARFERLLIA